MNKTSSSRSRKLLTVALVPFLAVTGALPLTGCDNGGGSSSSSSNSGTNVAAPTSLPAGLVVTTPSGKFTIVDGTNYTFVGNNPADSNSGTYTYVTNGSTATLILTPSGGGSPNVITISNFSADNGVYTGATIQSAGEGVQTVTFSGVPIPYTAPRSGGAGTGINITNAPAPNMLSAGLVAAVDNGKFTFVDSTHWRNDVNDGTVTTGTYPLTPCHSHVPLKNMTN